MSKPVITVLMAEDEPSMPGLEALAVRKVDQPVGIYLPVRSQGIGVGRFPKGIVVGRRDLEKCYRINRDQHLVLADLLRRGHGQSRI